MISRSVGVCLFVCSAALLIFPSSASSQGSDWTFCASEGGVCAFTGSQEVRYGANGAYFYQTLSGGTACTNGVFGDPIAGTAKSCAVRMSDWTLCASEGGVCAFTGSQEVRYGANGAYFYKTLSGGTACTNGVFGDPITGTAKSCAVRMSDWTLCASEGGVCAFTGSQEVRYGANGAYFYKTLSGGTACTNSVFGDPIAGSAKSCAVRMSDWTLCASEGGVCAFTGSQEVRYGANGAYFYKTLSGGTACTNSVFGDPIAGSAKSCAVRMSDWTLCASEGGVCAFTGSQEVRYGANGAYFYKTLSGGTACTNSVFGDPAVGVSKRCDTRPASGPPPTPTRAVFVPSINHNTAVVEYVLEIFPAGADPTAANPVAAQNLGKPPVVNGECEADVRQTIANLPPGNFIATVSAFGNGISVQSAPSAQFTR